jgi:hypothetical protein
MEYRNNRLSGAVLAVAAATVLGVPRTFAAPAVHADDGARSAPAPEAAVEPPHAAPADASRPPEAGPAAPTAARGAARPVEASPAAAQTPSVNTGRQDSSASINSSAVGEHHDDQHGDYRKEHREDQNRNGYFPLGYSFAYFDPAWSGYGVFDNGNQSAYQLLPNEQPDQQNADFAPSDDQSLNPPTPQTAAAPGGGSPALDSALMASPQWRDANAQVQIAQSEYDTAWTRVIAQLRQQPAFQQALAKKEQDAQRVAALKTNDPNPAISTAAAAATAKLDAAKQVTDMEAAALAADPQASAAKAKLDVAIARRNEARQAVIASLPKPASAAPR